MRKVIPRTGSARYTAGMPSSPACILRLALPVPLRRVFDYGAPPGVSPGALPPGIRVRVPFGRQVLVGILLEVVDATEVPPGKLKPAEAILDEAPLLSPVLLGLGTWAAAYYQHPVGEVLATMLPVALREGQPVWPAREHYWRLAGAPDGSGLRKASPGRQLFDWLSEAGPAGASREAIRAAGFSPAVLKGLAAKKLVESCIPGTASPAAASCLAEPALALNEEQQVAVAAVVPGRFSATLLEGVTGSGKTEVYLQLIDRVLARGEQALVLVPEIGLTPQTVARFRRRFHCPIAVLHSGLADGERLAAWREAARGAVGIVIGTRSAVFTPLRYPGITIVDEEHDSSFKQQDGFRYSARDLAVLRAQREGMPVVLGTATPSLETLYNAMQGRYHHVRLTQRAGKARSPLLEVVDTRGTGLVEGFAPAVLQDIRQELAAGNQVMVFLNRRGFSPAIACADCRWQATCPHCSAKLTVHRQARLLRCHHCEYREPLVAQCPQCRSRRLDFVGLGTQRSEQFLAEQLAEYPVLRIDRDSTARRHALDDVLATIRQGESCVLVGTQMLAKGHHFPDVTLVVILDIDSGLFSADFRGAEKMGQLLEQVAGRAGRAEKPGRVVIQSRYAEHPLLQTLLQDGYGRLARLLLAERQQAGLPPYGYLANLRAEHADPHRAQVLLRQWRDWLLQASGATIQVAGPWPAIMEKRAGLYRFDLQVRSENRRDLQQALAHFCAWVEGEKLPAGCRWSLDVDPAG